MKQTRLSIGCRDWQETVRAIGPAAAAVYLYLRTLMRGMQSAEITVTLPELAEAVKLPQEATEGALRAIAAAGFFVIGGAQAARAAGQALHVDSFSDEMSEKRAGNALRDSEITLFDPKEAAAQADMFRKRASRVLARNRQAIESVRSSSDSPLGRSDGQSGVITATIGNLSEKQFKTDFFMSYHGPSEQKEKEPRTPQKEESLTEIQTRTRSNMTCAQPELPADSLEAEYIDVCGSWPANLRKAVRNEAEDVREAFYLYLRKRQTEGGRTWSSDEVRIALLAAKRVPEERRAESILAASMGGWKTIRDAGSGCYFEKETGRVVSLVRGPVERRDAAAEDSLAVQIAKRMRRA